ncbi:DUF4132 domain-containing protein [Streptomyces sp. NPDC050617]|uniref:DUF4132 domain-containing protein n=1 Tax=Streptomyces sp. NPDC050617 TaxID=3154628 RepID=UPI003441FA9E
MAVGEEGVVSCGLPPDILDDGDAYGPAMRAAHPALLAAPGVAALLGHCRRVAGGGGRATGRWRRTTAVLLGAAPSAGEAVEALLRGIAAQEEHALRSGALGIAGEGNGELVRGLLWAAAESVRGDGDGDAAGGGVRGGVPDAGGGECNERGDHVGHADRAAYPDRIVALIGAVALRAGTGLGGSGGRCRHGRIATAAVAVLGTFDGALGEPAARELERVRGGVRNRTVLKGVDRALEDIVARGGVAPGRVRERSVPTVGLDARGMREEQLGPYTAVLSVSPTEADLSFRGPEGRVLKSPPKALRAEYGAELAELRAALKRLRTLLPAECDRLAEQLAGGTVWSAEEWAESCLDHPVTGAAARTLLWEASDGAGGAWIAGFPERTGGGWALAGAGGTADRVEEGALLRLWHPVRAGAEEVRVWREEAADRELRQPFPQIFRDACRPGRAEEESPGESVRFAGRLLRYGPAKELMAKAGWTGGRLGYGDARRRTEAVRDLPRPGELRRTEGEFWRAQLLVELVRPEEVPYESGGGATGVGGGEIRDGGPVLCATGPVRFERRRGPRGAWTPVAPADVPALAFSEAMRDVGLFVAGAEAVPVEAAAPSGTEAVPIEATAPSGTAVPSQAVGADRLRSAGSGSGS